MIKLSSDIWSRWKRLRADLETEGKWNVASLFMGHEPEGFRQQEVRVHYLGKATSGDLESDDPGDDYFFCNKKAFWNFARTLCKLVSNKEGDYASLAWSNICKIGVKSGNPGKKLAERQHALAVETLRQEWRELNPTLVVCAAEDYLEDFIYEALEIQRGEGDQFVRHLTVNGNAFYFREATASLPAFFWMKHPQGKPTDYVEDATSLAEKLLSHKKDIHEGGRTDKEGSSN